MNNYDFMSFFKPETLCIKEFKYWIVCIRSLHTTLGSAVIILKREIPSIANMLPEEAVEFTEVTRWYESVCAKKFGAIKFNYLFMMMKDSFVHCHAFPRYDKVVNMFDIEWKDIDFPRAINFKGGFELDDNKLQDIIDCMSE